MNKKPTRTLQAWMFCLPKYLRRIRVAQWLGLKVLGTSRHELDFGQGVLVGDIRDGAVANALAKKTFADYGYYQLARNLLSAGGTHLDVGANFGFHTFGLFSTPTLRALLHIMVETNPECCTCLNFSRELYPGVRSVLLPCAVGRAEGQLRLSFQPGEMGAGYVGAMTGGEPVPGGGSVIEVPCRRLDDILPEVGAKTIRLMKMDIEGSEVDAMLGAQRYLAEGRIEYVYFEVNGWTLSRRQTSIPQLLDVMTAAGFQLFWPHNDFSWIETVCGRKFDPTQEKFACLPGPDGLVVTVFDPLRHTLNATSQLDLLAVHHSQKLEIWAGG
jgi:FkbM family methyltransferase